MTASFRPELERDLDRIRADLGDTDMDAAYLTDEQIDAALMTMSYDAALVRLGHQVLAQIPTKMQVIGLSVDMSGPIAALKSIISAAQARIATTAPKAGTFQVRRPQRPGREQGSEYGREREPW